MATFPSKLGAVLVFVVFACAANAQSPTEIQSFRTKRLFPLPTAPQIDWSRIQNAYAFEKQHHNSFEITLETTFILSYFASKDNEAVIVSTAKFHNDYNQRMLLTVNWMNEILSPPQDKQTFVKKNYKRSVDLGLMHLEISQATKVNWSPKVRVPASQQAFAYMLSALMWTPLEKMIATHEIEPAKDKKSIDDWLYLWHVLGYGMGLDAKLLPTDFQQWANLAHILRASQYPGPGDEVPRAIRDLIRSEMQFLYDLQDNGRLLDDPTKLEIRKKLASEISYSPGLSQALGLGEDPLKGLQILTDTID